MRLLFIVAAVALNSGLIRAVEAPVDSDRFMTAFRQERFEEARAFAAQAVSLRPDDGAWLAYLAAADEKSERHEDAVDAFAQASVRSGEDFFDRQLLWLRARALVHARLYARAHDELATLALRYPYSRLASADQELQVKIARRLDQGVDLATLNWYWQQAIEAHVTGKPGLAAELCAEWLLLSARARPEDRTAEADVRLESAAAWLELGAFSAAADAIAGVPDDYSDCRAALLRALALRSLGRRDDARRSAEVAAGASNSATRAHAQRLIALLDETSSSGASGP